VAHHQTQVNYQIVYLSKLIDRFLGSLAGMLTGSIRSSLEFRGRFWIVAYHSFRILFACGDWASLSYLIVWD